MNILKAILSIRPGSCFEVNGDTYEGLTWHDDNELPPPTEEEIQAEIERLQAEYEYNQYQRNRATAYPSIQEQLDMLWHSMNSGEIPKAEVWKAAIDEVKNKYPKPEVIE